MAAFGYDGFLMHGNSQGHKCKIFRSLLSVIYGVDIRKLSESLLTADEKHAIMRCLLSEECELWNTFQEFAMPYLQMP